MKKNIHRTELIREMTQRAHKQCSSSLRDWDETLNTVISSAVGEQVSSATCCEIDSDEKRQKTERAIEKTEIRRRVKKKTTWNSIRKIHTI